MTVQLNHTIVWSTDQTKSASFVAGLIGLPAPRKFGHFDVVELDNGVTLDFADAEGPVQSQHYAFLVSEDEFDAIFDRLKAQGVSYWADPMRRSAGRINHGDGGRGVYFADLDDHLLEIITRPYGGES